AYVRVRDLLSVVSERDNRGSGDFQSGRGFLPGEDSVECMRPFRETNNRTVILENHHERFAPASYLSWPMGTFPRNNHEEIIFHLDFLGERSASFVEIEG